MRNLLARLWVDDAGFIVSTELMIAATILVIGVTIGQATLRDAVISELSDLSMSINDVNQSYSFAAVTGHSSSVAGSDFVDGVDFCQGAAANQGSTGLAVANGACVSFTEAASSEP